MLGGYDYTPEKMNLRDSESIRQKQSELIQVLPNVFSNSGYNVTFTDSQMLQEEETFSKLQNNVKFETLKGMYSSRYLTENNLNESNYSIQTSTRTFPLFSLFRVLAPCLRWVVYNNNQWWTSNPNNTSYVYSYIDDYAPLFYLPKLTSSEASGDTFSLICNETCHRSLVLEAPEYKPTFTITNKSSGVYPYNGNELYHVNASAILQVAKWIQYLKDNNIYDNTRIVIVSDHGKTERIADFENFNNDDYCTVFNCLLLYKDFNATGKLAKDNTFMTNADAPGLLVKNLDVEQKNPFTGNSLIQDSVKDNGINTLYGSSIIGHHKENTFVFDYENSFHVKDDIHVKENWEPIKE